MVQMNVRREVGTGVDAVPCSRCAAVAGAPCTTPAGVARRPHRERREAAGPLAVEAPVSTVAPPPAVVAPPPVEAPPPGPRRVRLDLPVGEPGGRPASYLQFRPSAKQRRGLRALFDALYGREHLENGRVVRQQVHAVRWMLERLADAVEPDAKNGTDR